MHRFWYQEGIAHGKCVNIFKKSGLLLHLAEVVTIKCIPRFIIRISEKFRRKEWGQGCYLKFFLILRCLFYKILIIIHFFEKTLVITRKVLLIFVFSHFKPFSKTKPILMEHTHVFILFIHSFGNRLFFCEDAQDYPEISKPVENILFHHILKNCIHSGDLISETKIIVFIYLKKLFVCKKNLLFKFQIKITSL